MNSLDRSQEKASTMPTAIDFARELNADVIVLIDGDDQHLLEELPRLIRLVLVGQAYL
jgi:hypothetical protein